MSRESFKICFCFRRIFKLRALEPPEEVKDLFDRYSQNGIMSLDHLRGFLVDFQGEYSATREDAQAIFNSLKHLNIFSRRGLHLEAFFRYLIGDLNGPLSAGVHHDMTQPLAHYFMYTGHNSYLTGNQLSSDSSVEPIVKALGKGVRVIELDLWPGSKKDAVEVRHGGTLTNPVDLLVCLKAIKDNAFQASEYPVVITFEDHLPENLQAQVAEMVTETFGDMLYRPETDQLQEFPSPESLKKKVMISTKPPKESKTSSKKEQWNGEATPSKSDIETSDKDEVDEGENLQEDEEEMTAPEYMHLISIHAGKPKGGLQNWLSIDEKKVRRLSLSEQELENATRRHGTDIVRFTQRNLLRVYPKGTRITSSNYNPFVGWAHGAQMVAFNMQGYGKHLWVMQGMFKANGGCGYVKKPEFLLSNVVFDPSRVLPVKKILKVTIYMGVGWDLDFRRTHFDMYSPPDFFVKVGIAGVPADKNMQTTKAIEDDWQPVWNERFEFKLTVPELAVLRIAVLEYDTSGQHDFGGQTCLPISELRTGIRAIPLHDRRGDKFKNTRLLVQFELN